MLASEMVSRLIFLMKQHDDFQVYMDIDSMGLRNIQEIDVDADDTGIIIWPSEGIAACPANRDNSVGVSLLSLVGITVDEAIVSAWDNDQYWSAIDWASAAELKACDHDDIEVPEMPEFLKQYETPFLDPT